MFCWQCISIHLCNINQLDAPFILSLFRLSISTFFTARQRHKNWSKDRHLLPALLYYLYNDHFDFNIRLYPFIFYHFLLYCQFEPFLRNTWICFNVFIIKVIPSSFVSTFSHCCKHFGIPKVCTFTWCTSNMVQ